MIKVDSSENLTQDPSSIKEVDYEPCGCLLMCCVITLLFPVLPLFIILLQGFIVLQPNEGVVLTLYGKYKGTLKQGGCHWINPYLVRTKISLKSNNHDGKILKVNDKVGNPINISANFVWHIKHTGKAVFGVSDYWLFVSVQYESALRHMAMIYPYEKTEENEISLRSGDEEINHVLVKELMERLEIAGIEIEEARITTLSYSEEIAGVMLKRQQADAVITARQKIVSGAIGIIGNAIQSMKDNSIVNLNQEEKARLVLNLLPVLCSDSSVQPIFNAGS